MYHQHLQGLYMYVYMHVFTSETLCQFIRLKSTIASKHLHLFPHLIIAIERAKEKRKKANKAKYKRLINL